MIEPSDTFPTDPSASANIASVVGQEDDGLCDQAEMARLTGTDSYFCAMCTDRAS